MPILVATDREVVVIDVERGTSVSARGISDRPTCLAADALVHGRAWCGTHRDGVFRTDDGGRSWRSVGLAGRLIMAIAASPVERDVVWVGTEPSEVWRSADAGTTWEQTSRLETLPRRQRGHFRRDRTLITFAGSRATRSNLNDSGLRSRQARSCRRSTMAAPGAIALLVDRGTRTSSPFIAMRPIRCASLRATDTSRATTPARRGARQAPVSRSATCAAWRSIRGNRTSSWYQRRPDRTPRTWLADRMAGCIADVTPERWERVRDGWPEPPSTIAPLLCAGAKPGEMWAADERGVHRSDDSGNSWRRVVDYATSPQHLRGLALLQ